MPNISLRYLKVGDPPVFPGLEPILRDQNGDWQAVVIEEGMASGQPSVAIVINTTDGPIVIETSLAVFQSAARGLVAMAETQFGWTMPP